MICRRTASAIRQLISEVAGGSEDITLTAAVGFAFARAGDEDPDVVLDAALHALEEARKRADGVAGALTAPLVAPTPYIGHSVIVTAFIIIIVGGIGSLEGAVVAAILYALVDTFVTTLFDGVIANIVGLVLMLVVLIVMPNGLFGARERV